VIYWAWNNLLTVAQQSVIMRRNGVKVELFDNLRGAGRGIKGLITRLLPARSAHQAIPGASTREPAHKE
jgi:membrane protein insertase Oxa1/YidC/SpoIIIJ